MESNLELVIAHVATDEVWDLGFFLRYSMGHVYVVGFVRRRLNVHNSKNVSHGLLDCWILT